MRSYFTVLGTAAMASLWMAGCGSDDNNSNPGGAAGAASDVQCQGDYAELTQAQLNASLDPAGKCAGTSDRVAVCGQNITRTAELCGGGCYMMVPKDDASQDACVVSCMNENASPKLSEGCTECYVADVRCARDNCLLICGLNPTGAECGACRNEFHCSTDFFSCSGLPGPGEPDGAAGAGN